MDNDIILPPAKTMAEATMESGGAMQQIRTKYSTAVAVQQPRNIESVSKRFMQEARLAGEAFYYGWGAGKNRIEGPTIGAAMAVARCWGNCAIEMEPMQETKDAWIFTANFVDLETGFTVGRQFRQSKKWTVYGKHDDERKDDIRFQIGQSKAARNVACAALPRWLMDNAMAEAKAGVREKIQRYIDSHSIADAVDVVVKELKKLGVTPGQVCEKFSVAQPSGLTIEHLVIARGDITALQAGQERAETLYPTGEGEVAARFSAPLKKPTPPADKEPETETTEAPPGADTEPEPKGTALDELPTTATEPPTKPGTVDESDQARLLAEYCELIDATTTLGDVNAHEKNAAGNGVLSKLTKKKVIEKCLAKRAAIRGARGGKKDQAEMFDTNEPH